MNLEKIRQLVSRGESATLEFKKTTANLKNAAETLCGFLNNRGGIVLIGVTDDKKIVGQDVNDQTMLDIAQTLKRFEPSANIDVQYIDFENNKKIIVLTAIPDSRSVPYIFDGRSY